MVNRQKIKGTNFENEAVERLTELIDDSTWRRVSGSGAIGTAMGEPLLMGDIVGTIPGFPMRFRVECKVGYSSSKEGEARSFRLEKLWLDKIKEEAQASFAFPFLIGKFANVRKGVRHFVVMDLVDFAKLMNDYAELKEELNKVLK